MKFARTRHALLWIWHQALTWSLVALVLLAVYVGLGRELMPLVPDYKPRLEAELSRQAGVPVRIQSLSGELDGLTPRFVAKGIELRNPHHPAQVMLRLPELSTQPSMLASLVNREPRLITTLRGINIHLVQQADGRIDVAELSQLASTDPKAAQQSINLLLRQPSLALKDGQIALTLLGHPKVVLRNLDLTNLNEGAVHWLSGRFHLQGVPESVQLVLNYQGNPLDWRQGTLHAYLRLPVVDMGYWLQGSNLWGWTVKSAHGGGEYWFDFQQGNLTAFETNFALATLNAYGEVGGRPAHYEAKNLQGLVALKMADDGGSLSVTKLTGLVNGQPVPSPRFAVTAHGKLFELSASQVAVAPLRQLLLASGVLPEGARDWLAAAAPTGWLPHIRLRAALGDDHSLQSPALAAEFKVLGIKAHGSYPGVSNLSGWIMADTDSSLAYIDSRHTVLEIPTIYHEPLVAESLVGAMRLRTVEGRWELQSDRLHMVNADAGGNAIVTVTVPLNDPKAASMRLLASIHGANGAAAYRYVPWSVAGKDTIAWLKSAITAGVVDSGDFLYDGPFLARKDLPASVMQMRFQVRDGRLAYQPGWPAVEGMQAEVEIDDSRLTVTGSAGHVYDTKASNVAAEIPNLQHPVLSVKARLNGPAADVMRLFRESPLKDTVGKVADTIHLDGDLSGTLGLSVPLAGGPIKVAVDAGLLGNTLRLPGQRLEIHDVHGPISYSTDQGLTSKELTGRLFDEDITGSIASTVHAGELGTVHVSVNGHVGVPALQAWNGSGLLRYLDGDSDYQADVYIPADSHHAGQFVLSSTLEGLRINLPAPFGKGLEPLALRYIMDLGDGPENNARLLMGRRLGVGMVWNNGKLERALIRAGGEGVSLPEVPGIVVDMRVPRFNLEEWQNWLAANSGSLQGDTATSTPSFNGLTLETRELSAEGYVFRSARIDARREGSGWLLRFNSDHLDGQAHIPGGAHIPNSINIDRIRLPLTPAAGNSIKQASSNTLSSLPGTPIQVQVKTMYLDRWPNLQAIKASGRVVASPYGMHVDQLEASNNAFSLSNAWFDWQWGGSNKSRLVGTLQSPDVGRILSGFGYTPSVTSGTAEAAVKLSWDGGPEDLSPNTLGGSLDLKLTDGRVLNVGAVTSASRIFGLLDIDNLRRRLHLDFSDVTHRGVSYDQASFTATINHGVMSATHFTFNGPSMKAEGDGSVDLVNSTLDQYIKVSVPLSSAVPVAAAVVGGPIVGGVVVAAEKVLDKQLGKLTTVHYHVGGNWNNPQVERNALTPPRPAPVAPTESSSE